MRRIEPLLLLLLAGCADDVAVVRVSLPLAPEDVLSTTVWVTDPSTGALVASATIAPTLDSAELGVPAERPLIFNLLARTDQPGPLYFGGQMPGYAARIRRQIPLGRDQFELRLTAHPAGALTLDPVMLEAQGAVTLALEGEHDEPPIEIRVDPEGSNRRILALRRGRYDLSVVDGPGALLGGEGLFVAARVESIGRFSLSPPQDLPPPEEPRGLRVGFETEDGRTVPLPVETSSVGTEILLRIDAVDSTGEMVELETEVSVELGGTQGILTLDLVTADRLPALIPARIRAEGRLIVRAQASLGERELSGALRTNLLDGGQPGQPSELRLSLDDPEALTLGTRVLAEVLDDAGLYVETPGTVDFGRSDPWVYFADGPEAQLDEGSVSWRIARPSGPRNLFVQMSATMTSTAITGTLTASVTFPVLETTP